MESKTEAERAAYLQARIDNALDNKKNMWKELRHLGLLPWVDDALHGVEPDELNAHFAGVSVSSTEDLENAASILEDTGSAGFAFMPVSLRDVELAVKHFTSQTCGEHGLPQSVILKALPTIGPHLVKLFNASFVR